MKVRDVMERNVVVVSEDDTLDRTQQLMRWSELRHLPVVHPTLGNVVGVISEFDVLRALAAQASTEETLARQVRDFMFQPVEHIQPDAELDEAVARITRKHLPCLPVVERGTVIGMLTVGDALGALAQRSMPRHTEAAQTEELTVAAVMQTDPLAVPPQAMLFAIAARMAQRGVRHACVVDRSGHVVGIISDRDLRRVFGHPTDPLAERHARPHLLRMRVEQVMHPPRTLSQDASVSRAVSLLPTSQVGALPITDSRGCLRGIVSHVELLPLVGTAPLTSDRSAAAGVDLNAAQRT